MLDSKFAAIKKELPEVQSKVFLRNYTTFRVGGPADYFLIAHSKETILKSIKIARNLNIPIFILGKGSNILFNDEGFPGFVIKIENNEPISMVGNDIIKAPAGAELSKVLDFAVNNSLKGLEWAGGLPGTLGGAICGNAGAFGGEIKDVVFNVQILDDNLNLRILSNKECCFSYRHSVFKEKNWIILEVLLLLEKGDGKELRKMVEKLIDYRQNHHPLEYPNAGSIFKNVDFNKVPEEFKKEFSDKVKKDPFDLVPAAWFIIKAGLVGMRIGEAQISDKHSNYIVNLGNASSKDIVSLIELVKEKVKRKYNIELEAEVRIL